MKSGNKNNYPDEDLRLARFAKALGHPARILILRHPASLVWEKYKCIKTSLPFFYNRRGLHVHGPWAATGIAWRKKVEDMIKHYFLNLALVKESRTVNER